MKHLLLIVAFISFKLALFSQNISEAKGLPMGAEAPGFSALDADSSRFVLSEKIQQKPVVIIFYRGAWCPVCNKHLSTVQDSLEQIIEAGGQIAAISPEKPEFQKVMAKKTKAEFSLLYDEDDKIAQKYGVAFEPKKAELLIYNTLLGAKLKETHPGESQRLPIPATYVIDTNQTIIWRHFDPNYKNRATVRSIINALKSIKE